MTPRRQRALAVLAVLAGMATATGLVLRAFSENLVFFYSPSQVAKSEAPRQAVFRLGGLVAEGSVRREGVEVRFAVTDSAELVTVTYTGLLPDLFQEGKGVVAQGRLGPDGVFRAHEVLARHDENYMPPEAAAALDAARESALDAARAARGVEP
jgi:cytochrome c-type biogenesis protein CcmE